MEGLFFCNRTSLSFIIAFNFYVATTVVLSIGFHVANALIVIGTTACTAVADTLFAVLAFLHTKMREEIKDALFSP